MLSGPPAHGAMALRAFALSVTITLVTAAAHATHGHAPSWMLLAVTAAILVGACLPASRARLTWARALGALVVGQFALHAWFAWFSLPAADDGVRTLALHHGPAASSLVARDFSGVIPSPGMALAHLAAAGVLAALLVHADWLLSAAVAIFGGSLRAQPAPFSVAFEGTSPRIDDSPQAAPSIGRLAHAVVRRGPPAYCV